MNSGFYSLQDGDLLYAPYSVFFPDGTCLSQDNISDYQFPVNGWIWADSEQSARVSLGIGASASPFPAIPLQPGAISSFQAKAQLAKEGVLGQVNAYVKVLPEDSLARLAWESGEPIYRNSPAIIAIGETLSLDLDRLFREAAMITSANVGI